MTKPLDRPPLGVYTVLMSNHPVDLLSTRTATAIVLGMVVYGLALFAVLYFG